MAGENLNTKKTNANGESGSGSHVLYHMRFCPYCHWVRGYAHIRGVSLQLRDVSRDLAFKEELIKGGGKFQVPCLRIQSEDGSLSWLYESSSIIGYLKAMQDDSHVK